MERSLDTSEFAKCSGRSVIEVDAIIDNAVNKMKYCFASLEVDILMALKERFGKETQVKSFDDPAIEMWVSDSGDVYLRGKLNVIVSNHNGFSDDDVNYIEGVWITGDGVIILRCCADWMVDIKTPDSSNSVDDVALLIKNAIERAIDGSEISAKYKVLY